MTTEIAIVLAILVAAIVLFVTERIRVDVVALMVLVSLALTGLITPDQALSGFANLAVVTVWAVLILSAGLARTGVAAIIGRQVLRFSGGSEARLIALIMLIVGVLSGFMNDIGVAALMLPVVVDIARRTDRPPSRLLMPLAFAALLGGLNTLIGTPPNILVSEALRPYGLEPFHMFDYTPTGVVVMVAGITFMVLVGRHLLPSRDIKELLKARESARRVLWSAERLFIFRLPHDSALAGMPLAQSRLGAALGLNVLAILRDDSNRLAPVPGPSCALVTGCWSRAGPTAWPSCGAGALLVPEDDHLAVEQLVSADMDLAEMELSATIFACRARPWSRSSFEGDLASRSWPSGAAGAWCGPTWKNNRCSGTTYSWSKEAGADETYAGDGIQPDKSRTVNHTTWKSDWSPCACRRTRTWRARPWLKAAWVMPLAWG